MSNRPRPTPMPDFTGITIDYGRLRFHERLGEGSYGTVYRAVDETSPELKQYAVKIIRKTNHEWMVCHQNKEVIAHMKVHAHPNIVSVEGVFECLNFIYLVLEYCEGGDLMTALIDRLLYTRKDALIKSVFLQIIDAVGYCHSRKVYHRDLKPENIMVNKDGTDIKLGDFGFADTDKISNTFLYGSGHYMAPEVIGCDYGFVPFNSDASDVWALGIILINLITGRNPWARAVSADNSYSEYLLNPNYLRDILPLSLEAEYILRGILDPDPVERWTLAELRQYIEVVHTFTMSEEEIAASNEYVQLAALTYCPPEAVEQIARSQSVILIEDARELLAEQYILEAVPLPCNLRPHALSARTIDSRAHSVQSIVSSSSGLSGWSSESDSEGPITPETHAQDAAHLTKVPELTSTENIGESVDPPAQKQPAVRTQFAIVPAIATV